MARVRKVLGGLLVAVAVTGLFPLWAQVQALRLGHVDTPDTDPAVYGISSANSLVQCGMPTLLVVEAGTPVTGNFIRCTNNHGSPITLNWAVVDAGPGNFLTGAGSSTLVATGVATCQSITLTPGNKKATRTVVFSGTTDATAGLYVELYFTGEVTVQQGTAGLGGGCP